MSTRIDQPSLLIVEGRDEELFFAALLNHMHKQNVQVLGVGGKTNIKTNLKALVLTPDFRQVVRVGIVRDADNDPEAAFQSVCGALSAAGLAVPGGRCHAEGNSPSVAVLILPPTGIGALEDICLQAVAADPAISCLNDYFRCIEGVIGLPKHLGKAKIQAFLASRAEEGKRLGEAALAGYWPWDSDAFRLLREFIEIVTI